NAAGLVGRDHSLARGGDFQYLGVLADVWFIDTARPPALRWLACGVAGAFFGLSVYRLPSSTKWLAFRLSASEPARPHQKPEASHFTPQETCFSPNDSALLPTTGGTYSNPKRSRPAEAG